MPNRVATIYPADLLEVSDPDEVKRKAYEWGYNPQDIYPSTHPSKKYMLLHDGKVIHFGDFRFLDYTRHQDPIRRQRFRARNHQWKDAPMYSAAHLSYHLLW